MKGMKLIPGIAFLRTGSTRLWQHHSRRPGPMVGLTEAGVRGGDTVKVGDYPIKWHQCGQATMFSGGCDSFL